MSRFSVGDKVRKVVGYPFIGTVAAVYENEEKCSVRHADGWDHIFHDKQLAYDHPEYQYLDLLRDCLENGLYREGRNGGTYGLFGRHMRFDLSNGFPLLTTKHVHWKSVAVELLWFLTGSQNAKYMEERGVTIWQEWGDPVTRDLGPVYGYQWRNWRRWIDHPESGDSFRQSSIDQIRILIDGLRNDPYSRRHILTAWNVADIDKMALPPCHCLAQFFVSDGKLSCQMYQRSGDVFLGVPFNIASYALLTHLMAREVGLGVGEFVHTLGDVHLYANHVEQAKEQLTRTPRPFPELEFKDTALLATILDGDYDCEDFHLVDYNPHPTIKAPVSA